MTTDCPRPDDLPAPSRPLLIGIGGGSGSGKSALARFLCEHHPDTVVIEVDDYYFDRTAVPPAERHRLNFDEPSAIEMPLLRDHLQRLRRGEAVAAPIYSFSNHTRIGTRPLAPAPLIVVEGLFALWWKSVRSLIDLAVYVDVVPDLRLARRIRRDTLERGRSVEAVLEQYLATVRPMHERYVEPTRAYVDLVVTNDGALEDCVKCVLTALDRIRSSGAHDVSRDSRGMRAAQQRPGAEQFMPGVCATPDLTARCAMPQEPVLGQIRKSQESAPGGGPSR